MDIRAKIRKLEALANDPSAMSGERDNARAMAQKLRLKLGEQVHQSYERPKQQQQSHQRPNQQRQESQRKHFANFYNTFGKQGSGWYDYFTQAFHFEDGDHEDDVDAMRYNREAMRNRKHEQPKEKPRVKVTYKWKYYNNTKTDVKFDDGKIHIDFTEADAKATDKQMAYILQICRHYNIEPPAYVVTFTCASEFLDTWSPKYQQRSGNW